MFQTDEKIPPKMKRPFFEFGYWGTQEETGNGMYRTQRWMGPHIRVGNYRLNIRRITQKYPRSTAANTNRRIMWQLTFYYDRKKAL